MHKTKYIFSAFSARDRVAKQFVAHLRRNVSQLEKKKIRFPGDEQLSKRIKLTFKRIN